MVFFNSSLEKVSDPLLNNMETLTKMNIFTVYNSYKEFAQKLGCHAGLDFFQLWLPHTPCKQLVIPSLEIKKSSLLLGVFMQCVVCWVT